MWRYADIGVCLVSVLASTPAFASSPYDPITSPCPSAAVNWTNSSDPKVDWQQIHSEMEARACVRDIARPFGPEKLKDWFSRNGFVGSIISNSGKRISVVSHWETDKHGLLYSESVWKDFAYSFAYGISISVTWTNNKIAAIGIGHLYE